MALPHSREILKYPPRFQFQPGAPCRGSSTCTDTCIQMIVEYYREKTYSLSYIRWAAQRLTNYNEGPCTGINYIEVINALNYLGVKGYKLATNPTASWAGLQANTYGPVIVGVHYGTYPNKRGRCSTARVAELSGRTDCGFYGAHAVLLIKKVKHYSSTGKVLHTDVLVRDPDHASGSRPERPAYDRMTLYQFELAMRALPAKTRFSFKYALYPTRKKVL